MPTNKLENNAVIVIKHIKLNLEIRKTQEWDILMEKTNIEYDQIIPRWKNILMFLKIFFLKIL